MTPFSLRVQGFLFGGLIVAFGVVLCSLPVIIFLGRVRADPEWIMDNLAYGFTLIAIGGVIVWATHRWRGKEDNRFRTE
jgi:hypothetical protein